MKILNFNDVRESLFMPVHGDIVKKYHMIYSSEPIKEIHNNIKSQEVMKNTNFTTMVKHIICFMD